MSFQLQRQRLAHPRLESLEDRTLMSTCHVTRLSDTGIGKGFRGDLRYCITKVNAEPGPDTIDFNVTGIVQLQSALPELASDIDIQGPGVDLLTVSAEHKNFRVFSVPSAVTVSISGLTMANGYPSNGNGGGGLRNSGTVTLSNCTISGNDVNDNNVDMYGGGVYNDGILAMWNCTVAGNENFSTWMLGDSFGGGIHNAKPGQMTIRGSTIANNLAANDADGTARGGGIYNAGTLSLINSTLSGNRGEATSSSWVSGGAVFNAAGGLMNITNSTIASNTVSKGDKGGIVTFGTLDLRNTIVATNTGVNVSGSYTGDHNLIGGDPKLGPLQDNGGPTMTRSLLPGSPAIDAGDNADAPELDQRGPGFPRIVNGTIDIGAFEAQSTNAPTVPPRSRTPFWNAIRETPFHVGVGRQDVIETEFLGSAFPSGAWERDERDGSERGDAVKQLQSVPRQLSRDLLLPFESHPNFARTTDSDTINPLETFL